MGYSSGQDGRDPSFDFFGQRSPEAAPDQAALMEKRKKDQMATDSPFEVGGDSQQQASPLLAALRAAPQRNLRGGGGGRVDYGDPRRGQGLGPVGWQGGYGRSYGGGQQQFYGPRQGQGLALGSGGTGSLGQYTPNPNATRRG